MCITMRDIHSCTHSGAIFSISRCPPYLCIESQVEMTTRSRSAKPDCGVAACGEDTNPGVGFGAVSQTIAGTGSRTDVASDSGSRADTLLGTMFHDESAAIYEEKQKCEQRTLTLFRRLDYFCRDCAMKQQFNDEEEEGVVTESGNDDDSERHTNEENQNRHGPELDREFETVTSEEEGAEQHIIAPGKSLQDIHLESDSEHEYAIFQSEHTNSDCSDEFLEMKVPKKGSLTSCTPRNEARTQALGTPRGKGGNSESEAGSVHEMQRDKKGSTVNDRRGRQQQEGNRTVVKIKGLMESVARVEARNARRIRMVLRGWVGARKGTQVGVEGGAVIRPGDGDRRAE